MKPVALLILLTIYLEMVKCIRRGEVTRISYFPFYVEVLSKPVVDSKDMCGGILVAEKWVLTPATCIYYYFLRETGLPLVVSTNWVGNEKKEYNHSKVFTHPEWTLDFALHDVGLIKTQEKINFRSPATLDDTSSKLKFGTAYLISAAGRDELLMANMKVHKDFTQCEHMRNDASRATLTTDELNTAFYCVGEKNDDKGPCPGDVGAPLSIDRDTPEGERYKLVVAMLAMPISTVNNSCSPDDDYRYIYLKLSNYKKWIEETIKNN